MRMAPPVGLDLDVLRSFVAIAEEKSFTRAAERVGRTQSAISLQIQRLETVLEQKVLDRGKGGSVELSPQGKALLGRAKEILAMNDDIVKSFRRLPVQGTVRLGVADEFSARFLSGILAAFAEEAPGAEVDVTTGLSCLLSLKLKAGEVDLAVVGRGLEPRQWPAEVIRRERLRWITSEIHGQHRLDMLPVVVSPPDCQWRPPWLTECLWSGFILRTLEQAGYRHRIAATAGTTAAQLALVMAGVAVAASLDSLELPAGLRRVGTGEGLPELPEAAFMLLKARDSTDPLTGLLADIVRDVARDEPARAGA
jgi:DNA-binding transcriptional LysR family regulator